MATAKKQKLVELDKSDKRRIRRITFSTFAAVALFCLVLVGCLACSQEQPQPEMTDEQKVMYWNAQIAGVIWEPMVGEGNDGVLKDLFQPRKVRTDLDMGPRQMMAFFLFPDMSEMTSAKVVLENESGKLVFEDDSRWEVKFSEKNEIMCMTITDSDGKKVFYEPAP